VVLAEIAVMHFILPGLLALLVSEFMRKKGWIKYGDMKLSV
jgi:Predicted membrane protein, putative toxin regulator